MCAIFVSVQGVEICETKGREIIAYSKKLVFDVKQIDQRVKECIKILSKLDIIGNVLLKDKLLSFVGNSLRIALTDKNVWASKIILCT